MGAILAVEVQYYSTFLCLHSDKPSYHVLPEPKPARTDTIFSYERMAQNSTMILFTKSGKTTIKILLGQRFN